MQHARTHSDTQIVAHAPPVGGDARARALKISSLSWIRLVLRRETWLACRRRRHECSRYLVVQHLELVLVLDAVWRKHGPQRCSAQHDQPVPTSTAPAAHRLASLKALGRVLGRRGPSPGPMWAG